LTTVREKRLFACAESMRIHGSDGVITWQSSLAPAPLCLYTQRNRHNDLENKIARQMHLKRSHNMDMNTLTSLEARFARATISP
jgi:hypothetical protein